MKPLKQKDAEFVICKECIYWEDCPNKENYDGCYLGEKWKGSNDETLD
jgi:hypothetical protein